MMRELGGRGSGPSILQVHSGDMSWRYGAIEIEWHAMRDLSTIQDGDSTLFSPLAQGKVEGGRSLFTRLWVMKHQGACQAVSGSCRMARWRLTKTRIINLGSCLYIAAVSTEQSIGLILCKPTAS
jgi:hypothetical protein